MLAVPGARSRRSRHYGPSSSQGTQVCGPGGAPDLGSRWVIASEEGISRFPFAPTGAQARPPPAAGYVRREGWLPGKTISSLTEWEFRTVEDWEGFTSLEVGERTRSIGWLSIQAFETFHRWLSSSVASVAGRQNARYEQETGGRDGSDLGTYPATFVYTGASLTAPSAPSNMYGCRSGCQLWPLIPINPKRSGIPLSTNHPENYR